MPDLEGGKPYFSFCACVPSREQFLQRSPPAPSLREWGGAVAELHKLFHNFKNQICNAQRFRSLVLSVLLGKACEVSATDDNMIQKATIKWIYCVCCFFKSQASTLINRSLNPAMEGNNIIQSRIQCHTFSQWIYELFSDYIRLWQFNRGTSFKGRLQ